MGFVFNDIEIHNGEYALMYVCKCGFSEKKDFRA
jgi:hypothetical protein